MGSLLFLGTGASAGSPVIGCACDVCTSTNPKNHRFRASALLTLGEKKFLIDVGPDFRQQALAYSLSGIDGLILTHTHYDHIGGLEELRVYNFKQNRSIPCLLSLESLASIKKLFYYLFDPREDRVSYTSQFDFQSLSHDRGEVLFCGESFRYFSYHQGGMKVLGFRIGSSAYVTDIKNYPESIFEDLGGVSLLVLSALRFGHSRMQFSIDEAIDFAERVGAKKTVLMHMSHEVEYEHLARLLPSSFQPAYDGLQLDFS